jgi:hypothetical protein
VTPGGPDAEGVDAAARVRRLCARLPGVTERSSHGAPAFFAGAKGRQFAQVWPAGHHDHDFPHLWCAAAAGAQAECAAAGLDWYFRPPYVGHRGWLGVRLDGGIDDAELFELLDEAVRVVSSGGRRAPTQQQPSRR